jgi:hypothetical protein
MNKLGLKYLTFLILFPSLLIAQKLKPILNLDDSKNYELYFVDVGYFHEPERTIIELDEPGMDTLFPGYFKHDFSKIKEKPKKEFPIFFESKKNGISLSIDNSYNFIINNQEVIYKLRDEWVGEYTIQKNCGYPGNYYLFVKQGDSIVEKLQVREGHRDVIIPTAIIEFSGAPFKSLDKSNKFFVAKVNFPSNKISKSFIEDAKKLSGISVNSLKYEDWQNYEGCFGLKFNNLGNEKIIENLESEMKKQFPNEKFEIGIWDYFENHFLTLSIDCNKSLAEAFKSYKIYKKWEPYEIKETEIFFKDIALIKPLIDKYIND